MTRIKAPISGTVRRDATLPGAGGFSTSSRPAVASAQRSTGALLIIDIDRPQLLRLLQTDTEIGEIVTRAFILRRAELIGRGYGDAVLLGSNHCAGTLRVRLRLRGDSTDDTLQHYQSDHGPLGS